MTRFSYASCGNVTAAYGSRHSARHGTIKTGKTRQKNRWIGSQTRQALLDWKQDTRKEPLDWKPDTTSTTGSDQLDLKLMSKHAYQRYVPMTPSPHRVSSLVEARTSGIGGPMSFLFFLFPPAPAP